MIEAPAISPQLVEQTRKRIEGNLSSLAKLARTDVSSARFYGELLHRVVGALAALDGAIWTADRQQGARIAHQLHAAASDSASGVPSPPSDSSGTQPNSKSVNEAARLRLALQALQQNEPIVHLIDAQPTDKALAESSAGTLAILVAIPGRQGPVGVLEIHQRGETPRATQQGNLRYCEKAAAIAADFEHQRRLKALEQTHQVTHSASEFIATVHGSLSLKETATRIANEGRRLCDVDRVTVLLRHGNRYQVEAISGAESFNARSEAIVALRRLADRTAGTGQIMRWQNGEEEKPPTNTRARNEVQAYCENAKLAGITIIPLDGQADDPTQRSATKDAKPRQRKTNQAKPCGIAIIEQVEPRQQRERLEPRVSVVREHGGRALSNAMGHENALLLPWRRGKAGSSVASRARILPRWMMFLLILGGISAAMILVPANFTLEARGTLEPTIRRNVFASTDGFVEDVFVRHGQQVASGEVLAQLVDVKLDVELAAKQGDLAATIERQSAVRDALLNSSQLHASQRDQLTGEAEQLRRTKESLERQLRILDRKLAQNQLLSPISGEVVTWDVEELLSSHRPVREGQVLMSVADSAGPWELELQLPEARLGHLLQAQRKYGDELLVEFILATEPGVTYEGRIKEIHRRAEVAGADGNSVLIKVAVDRDKLDQLHPGASVVAKFHCGEESLGYVLFHDVIEFAQRRILFRF